jgi:hypothetical protein
MDVLIKNALFTFIKAFESIEKLPVTDKFVKLMFELTVPNGFPFIVVTDNAFTDAFFTLIFSKFIVPLIFINPLILIVVPICPTKRMLAFSVAKPIVPFFVKTSIIGYGIILIAYKILEQIYTN